MTEDAGAVVQADQPDRAQRDAGSAIAQFLLNIETPKGLRKAADLAAAHPR